MRERERVSERERARAISSTYYFVINCAARSRALAQEFRPAKFRPKPQGPVSLVLQSHEASFSLSSSLPFSLETHTSQLHTPPSELLATPTAHAHFSLRGVRSLLGERERRCLCWRLAGCQAKTRLWLVLRCPYLARTMELGRLTLCNSIQARRTAAFSAVPRAKAGLSVVFVHIGDRARTASCGCAAPRLLPSSDLASYLCRKSGQTRDFISELSARIQQ